MELLDLPAEMVAKLMEAAVVVNGLDQAMMLRLVCRTFDTEILRAISTTKALEQPGVQPRYCGERLISAYLFDRTLADPYRRYFSSRIIGKTVDYIIKELPELENKRTDYLRCLCVAVVQSHSRNRPSGRELYNLLEPRYTTCYEKKSCSLEENSLAAAAYLNIGSLYLRLVQNGTKEADTCFGYASMISGEQAGTETAEFILNINLCKSSYLKPAARIAVSGGNLQVLQSLLTLNPNDGECPTGINERPDREDWLELIHVAARRGKFEVVQYLYQQVAAGRLLRSRKPSCFLMPWLEKKPPAQYVQDIILWEASENGHEQLVRLALDNGADLNTRRSGHCLRRGLGGASVLTVAAKGGYYSIVCLLIAAGAKISPNLPFLASASLKEAVKCGWLNIARLLIDHGAEINEKPHGHAGKTFVPEPAYGYCKKAIPVFIAIHHGQIDCVRILLEAGADINPFPTAGEEAYSFAKSRGDISIMRLWSITGSKILLSSVQTDPDNFVTLESWEKNRCVFHSLANVFVYRKIPQLSALEPGASTSSSKKKN